MNGRSIAIISEAVGGTNVDNCPHSCSSKPCGPLAQCVPNLESYECQCNPSNLQCNKAEELSIQQTRSSRTSFNFTGVSDNRSSILANVKTALYSKLTTTTTTTTATASALATSMPVNSIIASTAAQTNLRKVDKTTTTTTTTTISNKQQQRQQQHPKQQHKYNIAEAVATLSLSDSKSPVVQLNGTHAKSDKIPARDHSDGKGNSYANIETSTGMSSDMKESVDSDADADYYYYYDVCDDYEQNNDDSSANAHAVVAVAVAATATPSTTITAAAAAAARTVSTSSTTQPATTEQLTVKPMGISTDDDVTRVFGRYMAIDTEKLLKKEEMLKNKKLKKSHSKSIKPQKKHYIPMPLLEPQSPSLADDEVEIDVMLPITKNDHLTTTKTTTTTTTTTTPKAIANTNQPPTVNYDDENHDTDEMSGDFDVMGFYSNEDVLTTKKLIDDMARIMKNGAEIRRNQMNHKTKYVRKSHGACFTGADR